MVRASAISLESECTAEEVRFLLSVLTEHSLIGRHLEIGTAAGGTLKQMIGVYPNSEERPDFVVIDPMSYFENQLERVRENLANAGIDPNSVHFWKGTTKDFIRREKAAGGTFDFVFIDGDHRHYPVMIDLQWADLVRPGGFICLHDRTERFPGVGWAIDRFLSKNPTYSHAGRAGTLVALRKDAHGDSAAVTAADLVIARVAQSGYKLRRSIRKRLG